LQQRGKKIQPRWTRRLFKRLSTRMTIELAPCSPKPGYMAEGLV
jgi:hypothetical protein